jgi:hypothetical protein
VADPAAALSEVEFVGRRSPVGYETFSWADQIRLVP